MKTFIIELRFFDRFGEFIVSHFLEIENFTIPVFRVIDYATRIMDAFPECLKVEFVWKTK